MYNSITASCNLLRYIDNKNKTYIPESRDLILVKPLREILF